jgi:hypothetical protein
MKRLLFIFATVFFVGCSTTMPVKEMPPELLVKEKPNCMDFVIGSNPLKNWCSTLPKDLAACSCDTELVNERIKVFSQLARNRMGPNDLTKWYAIFPSTTPVAEVQDWMLSGIPFSNAEYWYKKNVGVENAISFDPLGSDKRDLIIFLLMGGLEPSLIIEWVKTGYDFDTIELWYSEGISPKVAVDATKLHNLSSPVKIRDYLFDLRFIPVTTILRKNTWICSKDNAIAQLLSVTMNSVKYIQRYRFIDDKGYGLEPFSLFIKGRDIEDIGILTPDVARGFDTTDSWSECMPSVTTALVKMGH